MRLTSQNDSVEICEPVNLATLDIILQCAFTHHSNCQDSGYVVNNINIVSGYVSTSL